MVMGAGAVRGGDVVVCGSVVGVDGDVVADGSMVVVVDGIVLVEDVVVLVEVVLVEVVLVGVVLVEDVVVLVEGGLVVWVTDVVNVGGLVVVVVGEAVAVEDVVVTEAAGESTTLMLPEMPNMPEELSATSRIVVSGTASVTLTVATPSVKSTALPSEQLPWAGYDGKMPSRTSSGQVKVRQCRPV